MSTTGDSGSHRSSTFSYNTKKAFKITKKMWKRVHPEKERRSSNYSRNFRKLQKETKTLQVKKRKIIKGMSWRFRLTRWTLRIAKSRRARQGIKWKGGLHSLKHLLYIVENIYKEGNVIYIRHMWYDYTCRKCVNLTSWDMLLFI